MFPHPATAQPPPRCHGFSVMLGVGRSRPRRPPPPAKPWRGVFFEGPEPAQDHEGEGTHAWHVFVGDKEAEPVGKVYTCYSFGAAQALAQRMARDRKLELICEAMPA